MPIQNELFMNIQNFNSHFRNVLLLVLGLLPGILVAQITASTMAVAFQNEEASIGRSLIEVLDEISDAQQVVFTYDVELLQDKRVRYAISKNERVEKILSRLLPPVGLEWRKLRKDYFVLYATSRSAVSQANKKLTNRVANTEPKAPKANRKARRFTMPVMNRLQKKPMPVDIRPLEFSVQGRVMDENGEPLVGATVVVKDETIGTVTDVEGRYELEVPDESSVLVFSYVGFVPREVPVNGQSIIDVQLVEDVSSLDEVVVIGYGERRKRDLTGSITSVDEETIEKIPFASPEFALQGNTTGVRVVNASGDPTAGPEIFVRGIGTWNGSAQPLYVIDGQIISPPTAVNEDLIGSVNLWNLINPQDIASISVLKDASAAAIYGSRGANGVILITTKTGKRGKPKVEVSAQAGVQNVPTFDLLNTSQFIELNREMYENNNNPDITLEDDLYGRNETDPGSLLNNFSPQFDPNSQYYLGNNPQTYDWQDAIRNQDALTQNYNVKVSGASESADYYVSLGYLNQESILKGNDLERYNLTANINTDINDFLRAGITYRASYQIADDMQASNLVEASSIQSWQPIYDNSNPFGFAFPIDPFLNGDTWNPVRLYGRGTDSHPLAFQSLRHRAFDQIRSMGQGYVEVEPIAGLTFRGALSLDWIYQQRETFNDVDAERFSVTGAAPESFGGGNSAGFYGLRNNTFTNYQADFTVNYVKSFGPHSIDILAAVQDQYYKRENQESSTDDTTTDDLDRIFIPNNRPLTNAFTGRDQKFWFGYVGRVGYNFDFKYYLDVSYRRDGSSGFPDDPDKRWGNFYSVSGAWRISQEPFMSDLEFLDDLKLRGGWGQAGNDEAAVGRYAFLSGVNNKGSYGLGSGEGQPNGNYNVGVALDDFPNRDLTWETVTTTYVGFDAILFNNKITASFEIYERLTEDILQTVQLPPTVGTNNPVQNIGSAQNQGIDLQLGYNGTIGSDFFYNVSGNISFVRNEVLRLADNQPISTPFGRVEEGRPIGHLWGYQLGGIFQSQAEIDAYFGQFDDETIGDLTFVEPGDMFFVDVYGNPTDEERFYSLTPDGLINNFDQTEIGNTIPGYTYGVNLSAQWKGFDLSAGFYGEGAVDRVASFRQNLENVSGPGANKLETVLDRWTPSNTSTDIPRAVVNDPAGNNRFSSRWVESAAFFRLNTWQIGYSLPTALLERTGNFVQRFRLYIGGQNNLYFTNWSGLDPVNDAYPLPRSYFLGVDASF